MSRCESPLRRCVPRHTQLDGCGDAAGDLLQHGGGVLRRQQQMPSEQDRIERPRVDEPDDIADRAVVQGPAVNEVAIRMK
jgi:hypothetical protein